MAARHYLVDFDGTIVQEDSLDLLFHGHADPAWLDYDSRWERGEIGSRENLSFALSTFSLSEPILRQVVSQLSLDPGFLDFLGWISLEGSSCTILSEGIDFIIWETLKAAFL